MSAASSIQGWGFMPRLSTLRILGSAFVLDLLAVSFVFVFGSSYLLNRLNAPAAYPGYALAVYGLVKLVVAPLGGWLLNKTGWQVGVGVSLALTAAGIPIALRWGSAGGFLVCVGFLAAGLSLAWLAVFAVAGRDTESSEHGPLGAWMGLTAVAATGAALGVGSLLALAHSFSPAAIFALGASLVFAALLLGAGTTVARDALAPPRLEWTRASEGVAPLGAVLFAHFAVTTGVAAIFIPFLLRTLDLQTHWALAVIAPGGALAAVTMIWSGKHTLKGRRFALAGLFYAASAVALLAASPVDEPWLVAILAVPLVAGFAGVVPQVNAAVLGVSRRAEGRGGALGWVFLAEGLGAVAGPLAAGGAISLLDVRMSLAGAGFVVAVLAITLTIAGRTKWLP